MNDEARIPLHTGKVSHPSRGIEQAIERAHACHEQLYQVIIRWEELDARSSTDPAGPDTPAR